MNQLYNAARPRRRESSQGTYSKDEALEELLHTSFSITPGGTISDDPDLSRLSSAPRMAPLISSDERNDLKKAGPTSIGCCCFLETTRSMGSGALAINEC
eukprot:gb/GECG01007582.1/.p1 GENE.gb/GECG01007582.1/~~gb/GECG01007582.1/.p1  ORF type:complete len:100 (+),score=12.55 gb/GECG01007582.1/:1-300(+)